MLGRKEGTLSVSHYWNSSLESHLKPISNQFKWYSSFRRGLQVISEKKSVLTKTRRVKCLVKLDGLNELKSRLRPPKTLLGAAKLEK